jgi:hypothetical protein
VVIDLREDKMALRNYVSELIAKHLRKGNPPPGMIHFGFTFDQDGWINAYLDTRPNASRDGEWTTHLRPESLLSRPHWYEASELTDLHDLIVVGVNGKPVHEWPVDPTPQNLANILGDFLSWSIAAFEVEGLFQPLMGREALNYSVEEFTGLYGWPLDPELGQMVRSLKFSGHNSSPHLG